MRITEQQRQARNAYMREWKRKNRERVNAINMAVKAKNPEKYREINRLSAAKMRAEDPDRFASNYRNFRARNPQKYLLDHARKRSKHLGVPFDLELEDIRIPPTCPVLGYPLEWGTGKMGSANWFSPSLDRFDPDQGYVKGNVDVISNRANHLKNNATLEEIEALAAYMRLRSG